MLAKKAARDEPEKQSQEAQDDEQEAIEEAERSFLEDLLQGSQEEITDGLVTDQPLPLGVGGGKAARPRRPLSTIMVAVRGLNGWWRLLLTKSCLSVVRPSRAVERLSV